MRRSVQLTVVVGIRVMATRTTIVLVRVNFMVLVDSGSVGCLNEKHVLLIRIRSCKGYICNLKQTKYGSFAEVGITYVSVQG